MDRTSWLQARADWLVIGMFEGDDGANAAATSLDAATGGLVSRLRAGGDFSGKLGETLPLVGVSGVGAERVLLVGFGKRSSFGYGPAHMAARSAAKLIAEKQRSRVAMAISNDTGFDAASLVAALVEGAAVGAQGQDLLKAERKRFPFDELMLVVDESVPAEAIERGMRRGDVLGRAVNLTRELVNLPPQIIFPVSFAERAASVAKAAGLRCEIFDEARIRDERMGALIGVAAGSALPPRFVVLEYDGAAEEAASDAAKKSAPRLALVGKGITFDSGGLSLKQTDQMEHMKGDMAGAATVLGAMQAIAELRLPVRVLGLAALAENMPGPLAMKVGDVLTARNGKTIEVLNTDAEGRLVLADALAYAVDHKASHIIDLATLTGSCVVALGKDVAGLMSNNAAWSDRVRAAADRVGERVWPLPMFDDYNEQIQSGVADLKNIGTRWGGAITAAKFLEHFVGTTPWVHLDIAGPAFCDDKSNGGGTGAFVRTLVELADAYASQPGPTATVAD